MRLILSLSPLLLLLALCTGLRAQTAPEYTEFLSGKVMDGKTGEPVAFVYVLLGSDQQNGVLTNETGDFRLPYTASDLTDTVFVSRIGYKVFREPLRNLVTTFERTKRPVRLNLVSEFVSIDAVTVRASQTPENIIRETLRRIPENYGTPEWQTDAYYRQYGLRNGAYTDVSEAIVTIQDGGYTDRNHRSSVYLNFLDRTVEQEDQQSDRLYGDENSIYTLYENHNNSARYQHIHWMNGRKHDFFETFDFEILQVNVTERDTIVSIGYAINPERAGLSENAIRALAGWTRGEVWINLTDYAIIRNTRGNENGDVFSEVYYSKIKDYYFPARITSIYAIQYGPDDWYVVNRMLCFSNTTNKRDAMAATVKSGKPMSRKKPLSKVKFSPTDMTGRAPRVLRISAPEATVVEEQRRAYQRSLGTKEAEGRK